MALQGSRRAPARLHTGVTCAKKKTAKSSAAAEVEEQPQKESNSPNEAKPKRAAKSKKAAIPEAKAKPEPEAAVLDAAPNAASDTASDEEQTAQHGDFVEVSPHFGDEADSFGKPFASYRHQA